jgi:hypothetical protein
MGKPVLALALRVHPGSAGEKSKYIFTVFYIAGREFRTKLLYEIQIWEGCNNLGEWVEWMPTAD